MSSRQSSILFLIPSYFYIEEYQKSLFFNDIPLGTLQLSALLKRRADVKTDIIDLRVESEKHRELTPTEPRKETFTSGLLKILEERDIQEFNYVGINCYTSFQYLQTKLIAEIIKEHFPHIKLIIGGYHVSGVPEDFLYKRSPFDIIITGEAEPSLLSLFNSTKNGKSGERKFPLILNSNQIFDVNQLPFPDYELYLQRYPFKDKFRFEFFISRGCPYQCAFCAQNYRFRSYNFTNFLDHFKRLMHLVDKFNPSFQKIGFADQSFNWVEISEKVLDYLIEHKLYEMYHFSCQSRVETVAANCSLIDKYQKANMVVGYGFETANNLLLREMHKTETPHKYKEGMVKILENYKAEGEAYCRVNVLCGFPGENSATFNETITFLERYALHENIQISPTLFANYPNVFVYGNMKYYEERFGTKFTDYWWKETSNPFKKSIPEKPSKDYEKKELINDYRTAYTKILKNFKRNTFGDLVSWKRFYNKWYEELRQN